MLGVPDAATRDFTAALSSRALPPEERAQALLQRGFLRDGEGKLNEAASDYGAVIAQGGDGVATALNNRANIYRRQSKFAEAKHDYQAALAAGGKAQYVWYGLGQIAEAEGDVLGARGFYAKAMTADPAYALASQRLAALGGRPEGAFSEFAGTDPAWAAGPDGQRQAARGRRDRPASAYARGHKRPRRFAAAGEGYPACRQVERGDQPCAPPWTNLPLPEARSSSAPGGARRKPEPAGTRPWPGQGTFWRAGGHMW